MTKTKSRESETKGEEGTKREHCKGRENIGEKDLKWSSHKEKILKIHKYYLISINLIY